jgi:hypothetical protein
MIIKRDPITHEDIRTVHDSEHHIALGQTIRNIHVRRMRAAVNDAVHIEIEMVEFRKQGIVGNNLIDLGIPLGDPAIELGISNELQNTSKGSAVQCSMVVSGERVQEARAPSRHMELPTKQLFTFGTPMMLQ